MADAQETRKLKPIYGTWAILSFTPIIYLTASTSTDALDTGSYKSAIQTCNKLLKKQPQHETIRVRVTSTHGARDADRSCMDRP